MGTSVELQLLVCVHVMGRLLVMLTWPCFTTPSARACSKDCLNYVFVWATSISDRAPELERNLTDSKTTKKDFENLTLELPKHDSHAAIAHFEALC